jgi:Zn ribbon nucleic-acid-binding protein
MSEIKCPNCQAKTNIESWKCTDGTEYYCKWCGHRWKINEEQELEKKLKEQGYSEESVKKILVWYT